MLLWRRTNIKLPIVSDKLAENKAWKFFRKLLNNDEQYFSFKNKKEPIMLTGSEGGKYYLYPDGNMARLDKDKPYVGRVSFGRHMAFPDFLSAVVVWVTKQEHLLKKAWGCGNLSLTYNNGRVSYEDGQPIPTMFDGNYTGTGFAVSSFNGIEHHPTIQLADDWNSVIGVALTSANKGDKVPIVVQGMARINEEGTIHSASGNVVMNMRATQNLSVGDLVTQESVEFGGESEDGEHTLPEQER
jgi:hypothetical protein